jgi:neopullulanase
MEAIPYTLRVQKIKRNWLQSLLACLPLAALLVSCPEVQPAPKATDWREQVIYFAVTDRFSNGSAANDNGANTNPSDAADKTNPLGWHGGDFAGLKAKIEEGYFKNLGATALWITPVVLQVAPIDVNDGPNKGKKFAGYHGYWAEDFLKIDPHFGTLAELKDLVKTAHNNNLKIVQDVVINHAGYGSSLVTAHPDWFHTDADCTASSNKTQDCPLAGLPDFKQDVPATKEYLNNSIKFLIDEVGIDGLRIDTMKHATDAYWQQFFAAGGVGDPSKIWSVGEVADGDSSFLAKYIDTLGSPSVFDFGLYYAIKDQLSSAGGNLNALADVFAKDNAYKDPTRLTTFVDNHDVPRFISEATNRGVDAAQAKERLDLALSLIFTARGTPTVYYGTEIGMAGKGDPYNFALGESNREDMDFTKVPGSSLAARIKALAAARAAYPALAHGTQQELWRPNAGAALFAFRRTMAGEKTVVTLLNNSNADIELSSLAGGGLPLLGTFENSTPLTEITGRSSNLSVDANGRLIGKIPARSALAITGKSGGGGSTNPALANVTTLQATPGDAAVKLSWTPVTDASVTGYRIAYKASTSSSFTTYNFAPLEKTSTNTIVRGLKNATVYEFKVSSVDADGRESVNPPSASATPDASITGSVNFTVDARSQGEAKLEVRRFDTGAQLTYPLTKDSAKPGYWVGTVSFPLFREIKFKFGNNSGSAKNSGYEGPDQSDRSLLVTDNLNFTAIYDFISETVPTSAITGKVSANGTPLVGALVTSSNNPKLTYAITFADGTYRLPISAISSDLTASSTGYSTSDAQTVTAPATGIDFSLTTSAPKKYTIDGTLTDWTTPKASLLNTNSATAVFGPDNVFAKLLVDWDDTYLYVAYEYRASGNSAIVYLDTTTGGSDKADTFDAWNRRADFANPVDYFLARYQDQDVQLRKVNSSTSTTQLPPSQYSFGKTGTNPANVSEMAIPWTSLGFSSRPSSTINFFAGVFGNDDYGAGDIAPDVDSVPAAASNTIGDGNSNRRANFLTPFAVTITP